jgi:DME family drug/metabolite transporter
MAMVLAGTIGPVQVLLGGNVGPAAAAGWRHLIGGGALTAIALLRPAAFRPLRRWAAWPSLLAAGLLSAVYQYGFFKAVSLTGAAMGTVVSVATVPLFAGVAGRLVAGERATRTWFAGSLLAVVGSAVLLIPAGGVTVVPAGVLWGVAAGAVFAAYTMVGKRLSDHVPNVTVSTGLSMLTGAVVLLPFVLGDNGDLRGTETITLLAWLGLGATAASYAAYLKGLQTTSANLAGTLSLGEPLAATLLSVAVLGERLSMMELTACLLIAGGLLIASVRHGDPATPLLLGPAPAAVGIVSMPRRGLVTMPIGVPVMPEMVGEPTLVTARSSFLDLRRDSSSYSSAPR